MSQRALLGCGCFLLLGLLATVAFQEWVREIESDNHLRRLSLAMMFYEDKHGHLPGPNAPTSEIPATGKQHPVSWRVLILPYVEQQALFD